MTFTFAVNYLDLEYKMKNILHIILISIISLTVISCSSDESDATTTSSGLYIAVGSSGTLLSSSDG